MRIAISGASGMIGRALVSKLQADGHSILKLVRRSPRGEEECRWDPDVGTIDAAALAGIDALINLSGDPIAEGRWTDAKKKRILESRTKSTTLLAKTLAAMPQKPKVWVNASAIGFYGDRGDDVMTEDSPVGTGFLADVCKQWEEATSAAEIAGIRVAKIRISMVLSKQGGALKKMLLPFKMGVGGTIGSGDQYMSWVTLDDLVRIFEFALTNESCRGPLNAAAPEPVTNYEFTKALGKALSRPTIFPMPAFAAKLVFGEMANELLLASNRVQPTRLRAMGFQFNDPAIGPALQRILN